MDQLPAVPARLMMRNSPQGQSDRNSIVYTVALKRTRLHLPSAKDEALLLHGNPSPVGDSEAKGVERGGICNRAG